MDPHQFLAHVKECCPELVLPSWIAQKSDKPNRSPDVATKFGGCSPWVSDTWKWPQCQRQCKKPTSFLFQINLADLPSEFKSRTKLASGLFQLFDCIECFKYSYGINFGCLRIIPQEDLSVGSLQYLAGVASKDLSVNQLPNKLQQYVQELWNPNQEHPHWEQGSPLQIFEERFVMNWEQNVVEEIPDSDEWELLEAAMDKLGVESQVIHNTEYNKMENKVEGADAKELKMSGPSSGTKMGGWFDWDGSLGYPGYPDCEDCPAAPRMDHVFIQLSISELLSSCQDAAVKSNHGYPDLIFIVLCPSCQKPAIFESFPPPLEEQS